MRNLTFSDGKKNYRRITKSMAAKAYQEGFKVVVIACNLKPFGMWHSEYIMSRKDREEFVVDEIGVANDFKNLVSSYEYYNCINNETGKYAAFYIAEE